jgi:hypothetical protein
MFNYIIENKVDMNDFAYHKIKLGGMVMAIT